MKKAKGYRKRKLKPSDVAPIKLPVLKKADGIDQEDFYNWLNNKANEKSFNKTVVDLLKSLYKMEKNLQIETIEKVGLLEIEEKETFIDDNKTNNTNPRTDASKFKNVVDVNDKINKSLNQEDDDKNEDIPEIEDIPLFRHKPSNKSLRNSTSTINANDSIKRDINIAAIRRTLGSINR